MAGGNRPVATCAFCEAPLAGKQKRWCSASCTRAYAVRERRKARPSTRGRPRLLRTYQEVVHGQLVTVSAYQAAEASDCAEADALSHEADDCAEADAPDMGDFSTSDVPL